MLVMTQAPWSANNAQALDGLIAAARDERATPGDPLLILLPLGEADQKPNTESGAFKGLAALAKAHKTYLAGATQVVAKGGKTV